MENDYRSAAYMREIAERLADAEELEELTVMHYEGVGARNRKLAVQGFDLGDEDGSVALAVLLFHDTDQIQSVSPSDANRSLGMLESFLDDALTGAFNRGREESSPAFDLALELQRRGRIVTRYRLYLITDGKVSDRFRTMPSAEINGVRVDFHIWDVQRMHQVYLSKQGREELEIDLTEWMPAGLRALKIAGQSSKFATYLTAVPGFVIADLYSRFGSRLLEGNVRSFLTGRGKVNKGIRTTILSEPDMFLAYNNGITATATGVTCTQDDSVITQIRDLQIVNGGQTTASLFYIQRDDGTTASFSDVVVQMKLVVVDPERAIELVPNISRFANSQNKVSEADFFSNSPFHIRLEELSRRVLVPAQPGVSYQTKWFYERTRGQYVNEKSKLSTADARKFQTLFPRHQLISKTDAAKYEVSWAMKPHIVSAGAQKNFAAFATEVAGRWENSDLDFNEKYFQDLVGKAILFNAVRATVSRAPWYQSGYLANIVAYTLSKFSHEIQLQGEGRAFNFGEIWSSQAVSAQTMGQCLIIAQKVAQTLTSPTRRVANVTEWAKSEECWRAVKRVEVVLEEGILIGLLEKTTYDADLRSAVDTQRVDSGIELQRAVLAFGTANWMLVLEFCVERHLLSPTDAGVLEVATGRKRGVPSERQSGRLLEILSRARRNGFDRI